MNLPRKCRRCGSLVRIKEAVEYGGYVATCSTCYDGAEDAGWARIAGFGDTHEEAADDWSARQEDEIQ